jgi:hypothetical protein
MAENVQRPDDGILRSERLGFTKQVVAKLPCR